ncbi:hypothetical protein ABVT39_012035 [Epinephelus coioides]
MEDYDKFVQHRLSCLRTSEEKHNRPPPASSLIHFYGQPILPPLLSAEQREEMQRYRDAAQEAAVHRKLKDDSRMAYVQTILQSVQLRKTPTLEELLQESEINVKSSYSHNSSSGPVLQSSFFTETKDSLLLSPPPERSKRDGVSFPLLTSTTCSAFFASGATPQQSFQDKCLIEQHYSQQESQPRSFNGASHQSVSSGYVTYEIVENTTSVSGRTDAERETHNFGSTEEADNMGGFFLHNTSNTIAKMPDIINHPPIDGEELERSGVESSVCNDFIAKDIRCISQQEDSVIFEHLEKSESSHLDSTEGGDNLPFTTVLDLVEEHSLDRIEGPVSSSENSGISDSPELAQTSSTHHSPATELHVQHDPTESESEPGDNHEEAKPSEEPYRMSLQALLKKSQEYRRRQRMLRNQAKTPKIQERARAEEQSLSDKENDEFPHKGTVTSEGKKTKERRGTFIPSLETSPKKAWENERMIESEFFVEKTNSKSESTHFIGDGNTKEITSVGEETTFKNLNISQEVFTEPINISAVPQQQPTSTETSPSQEAFYLTTCPAAFYNGVGKYNTIPAPNFCNSPVRCKSKGSIQGTLDGAETSKRKLLVETGLMEDHKVEELQNSPTAVPSIVHLMVGGDVTSFSAKSSQHIDQLESNLSSLKMLISDLESTLTENLKNHSQTESNVQSELSFKGIKHSRQSDSDYWKDKPRDDDDSSDAEQDQRYGERPRRQSDNLTNMLEDTGPEPSTSDMDDVPLKVQRLRIPDIFRNVPPSTTASCNTSVLADTSNLPVEAKNDTEGHNSTQSPSLNQSYDVDSPSGLWFLEGSESDTSSKGHLVGEKHLTPESGGEDQGGVSKVKRRLLMHVTEETQERSADASRGAGSVVRPNSSTPRAAVHWCESRSSEKDKQEQLKQAHAAQIRALQDEHRRQQEELLQVRQ